ncbi:hypothetical protein [Runella sp. SP2]|uniref:hypothetical protein n=1 Tax=Runella sp. SP2 TaxID=2268026 RepID=UPI000F084F64|nr:hypothetical protein [Runella sp. SP2]AYQ36569.1 hypothetical protein DTQ70_30065 [Runella sp. SP2]
MNILDYEQGTNLLTLQARFDFQASLRYIDNSDAAHPKVIDTFLKPHDSLPDDYDLIYYFLQRFEGIRRNYFRINDWFQEEIIEVDGKEYQVKKITAALFRLDTGIIDNLWNLFEEQIIVEGDFETKRVSEIGELNDSLKAGIEKFAKNQTNKNNALKYFEKYVNEKLNTVDSDEKTITDSERVKRARFEDFRSFMANPKDEKYKESFNFQKAFWDLGDLFALRAFKYKAVLREKLDRSPQKEATATEFDERLFESLLHWRHDIYVKEYQIVKDLALKHWNYQFFLAQLLPPYARQTAFPRELQTRFNTIAHFFDYIGSNKNENTGKLNDSLRDLIRFTENTKSEVLNLKLRADNDYEGNNYGGGYPQIFRSDKEMAFNQAKEEAMRQLYVKLRAGIYGKIENSPSATIDPSLAIGYAYIWLRNDIFHAILNKMGGESIQSRIKKISVRIEKYEEELRDLICGIEYEEDFKGIMNDAIKTNEKINSAKVEKRILYSELEQEIPIGDSVNSQVITPDYLLGKKADKYVEDKHMRNLIKEQLFEDKANEYEQLYKRILIRREKRAGYDHFDKIEDYYFVCFYEDEILKIPRKDIIGQYFAYQQNEKLFNNHRSAGLKLFLSLRIKFYKDDMVKFLVQNRERCSFFIEQYVRKLGEKHNTSINMKAALRYSSIKDYTQVAQELYRGKKENIREKIEEGAGLLLYCFIGPTIKPSKEVAIDFIKQLQNHYCNGQETII